MTSRKKAREILIFFTSLILCGLFYLALHTYNKINKNKISYQESIINEELETLDSLRIVSESLLDNNSIYNFLEQNDLTKKTSKEFLERYANPDSSKIIYEFMMTNNLTDLTESSFYEKYLNSNDAVQLLIILDSISKINNELKIESKKHELLKSDILDSDEINGLLYKFSLILAIIVYPLRFSLQAVKWSFKTLRDK